MHRNEKIELRQRLEVGKQHWGPIISTFFNDEYGEVMIRAWGTWRDDRLTMPSRPLQVRPPRRSNNFEFAAERPVPVIRAEPLSRRSPGNPKCWMVLVDRLGCQQRFCASTLCLHPLLSPYSWPRQTKSCHLGSQVLLCDGRIHADSGDGIFDRQELLNSIKNTSKLSVVCTSTI